MINNTSFIVSMTIGFVLSTIFGLYLRLYNISEPYHEFGNKEKSYIKYAPIVFIKVIKRAIKTRDKKILKYSLTNFTTLYTIIGIGYCIMCGDFNLTYESLDKLIDVYKKEMIKWKD